MIGASDSRNSAIASGTPRGLLQDPYTIRSLRAVPAPGGATGPNWHRYEIQQGANTIVGYRSGSAENIREVIESIVAGLNERRLDRRGRVQIFLGTKSGSRGQTAER